MWPTRHWPNLLAGIHLSSPGRNLFVKRRARGGSASGAQACPHGCAWWAQRVMARLGCGAQQKSLQRLPCMHVHACLHAAKKKEGRARARTCARTVSWFSQQGKRFLQWVAMALGCLPGPACTDARCAHLRTQCALLRKDAEHAHARAKSKCARPLS